MRFLSFGSVYDNNVINKIYLLLFIYIYFLFIFLVYVCLKFDWFVVMI